MFARFSQLFPFRDESKDGKPIFRPSTSFNSEPEPELSNPKTTPDWPLENTRGNAIKEDDILNTIHEDDEHSVTSARADMEEVAHAPAIKKMWRGEQDFEEQVDNLPHGPFSPGSVMPSNGFEERVTHHYATTPASPRDRKLNKTSNSYASYHTARSSLGATPLSYATAPGSVSIGTPAGPPTAYRTAVKARGLVLPQDKELNWSGKKHGGQHVEFAKGEEPPLEVIGPLGMGMTAIVEKVRCRRIFLARKTMTCASQLTLSDCLAEVEHLHKLSHPHIIQLVGSYIRGSDFSVLLYPVADYHLTKFYNEVFYAIEIRKKKNAAPPFHETGVFRSIEENKVSAMWSFFECLASGLEYIHQSFTKHLDIKPANILVKRDSIYPPFGYRVYITDFGISKSFVSLDHTQTEDSAGRTPKYCPPEIRDGGSFGRSADIFSLGCVFMEMLTILAGFDMDEFTRFRTENGKLPMAYNGTLVGVKRWAEKIRLPLIKQGGRNWSDIEYCIYNVFGDPSAMSQWGWTSTFLDAILGMIHEAPEERKRFSVYKFTSLGGLDFKCIACGSSPETFRVE